MNGGLRYVLGVLIAAIVLVPAGRAAEPVSYVETPSLAARVADGSLPPVSERLPDQPLVVTPKSVGRSGGTLRTIVGRSKDIRLMVVYGYARLVGYGDDLEIHPDILEKVDVKDYRVFTLHLRKNHKWSDGYPFTTEDFRYYWEDVANNKELAPGGPPRTLFVNGKPPKVEVLSDTAIRYSWDAPNPFFLPALAGTTPLYIYRPAHYLKAFHKRYADPEKLRQMVAEAKVRNWAVLHNRRDNQYRNDNPDLPTLEPWMIKTRPPSQRFEFVRNPFFHRVDPKGHQLPYIDKVIMSVTSGGLIAAKTGSGESDLQARGLAFSNYPFLKDGAKQHGYAVDLWRTAKGSHIALFPNLNYNDPAFRALFRDVRFRRALSLAINRDEINQVIYFGLALPGQNAPLPQSPLYKKKYRMAWAKFDLKEANRLLDEIGLTKRDDRGVRLMKDGRPLDIIVETAGESTEQTDVLQLVQDTWLKAGIKLFTRPSQREVFRDRIFAGTTMVSVWSGYENGLPTADTIPSELAPVDQNQLQWPKWGQYYQTRGRSGEPIDMPAAQELFALNREWISATTKEARRRIWERMLQIHADDVFSIGVVSGTRQPIVVSRRLRNVPAEAVYNWQPGAHFGIYRPDTFYFASN